MKRKATVELLKQNREQQVPESKKASGLTMFHLKGYVQVSSATLAQSCRKAISLHICRIPLLTKSKIHPCKIICCLRIQKFLLSILIKADPIWQINSDILPDILTGIYSDLISGVWLRSGSVC